MNNPERLSKWVAALEREIGSAQAGSSQGQFPILDLLGNLRDEAASKPEWGEPQKICAEAWERMVKIVESGNSFAAADLCWLKDLFPRVQILAGGGNAAAVPAAPAPPQPSNPPPVTTAAVAAGAADPGARERTYVVRSSIVAESSMSPYACIGVPRRPCSIV